MLYNDTDKDWEKYGATNPYFGVFNHQKYCREDLTEESKNEFFKSGQSYFNSVLKNIRDHIDSNFVPKNALDFGCGVGRITIPLARISNFAVGIDVSESMLQEAKANCESKNIDNVKFLKADENLSNLSEQYDFIHSFIVFQHIPIRRGEALFCKLMEHLQAGGIGVFHFTYYKNYGFYKKIIPWIKSKVPLARNIIDLMMGRGFFTPRMQMNNYSLNNLFYILQKKNVTNFYGQYTNHNNHLGVIIFFKKSNIS
jgi:SAM-dependent methyltransferase